ncbi:MAG TPA: zinc ribbon domain-containing protein [Ardenticatenaceae bacterium]|nr:zinc ribbon domain-containing protein [Ardenticatenaceae bacterium]
MDEQAGAMIDCPTCGAPNPPGSRTCAECRAPIEATAPPESAAPESQAGERDPVSRLRAFFDRRPHVEPVEPLEGGTDPDQGPEQASEGDLDGYGAAASEPPTDAQWDLGDQPDETEEVGARQGLQERGEPPPGSPVRAIPDDGDSHLPVWLRGAEREQEPGDELAWDAGLDFSDLPAWTERDNPASGVPAEARTEVVPDWMVVPALPRAPRTDEPEGRGLLRGIRGPIPIGPIIAVPHPAPAPPKDGRDLTLRDAEAVALFAQIAATPLPTLPPVTQAEAQARSWPLNLLLLLAVIVPLALRLNLAPAPGSAGARAYGEAVASVQPGTLALVALDYEGGLTDDLDPAVAATLQDLEGRGAGIVAISTVPQGPALAQRLWLRLHPDQAGYGERFANLGYLPGGEPGLRTLLADGALAARRDVLTGSELREMPLGQGVSGLERVGLLVVASGESRDVQRWIEQIGSQRPELPIVAVTTAAAEPVLAPYVAAGQLRGALAGLSATAAYERAVNPAGAASRRLDALAATAALVVLVIVLGNAAGLAERLARRGG